MLTTIRNLLYVLLVFLFVIYIFPSFQAWWISKSAEPRTVSARGELAVAEQTSIDIFRQASPSVVFITTLTERVNFWTRDISRMPRGTGSGFVWDQHGHVVTNYHVIKGASEIHIRLNDQRSFRAVLVGSSPAHDIAVLRMPVPINPPTSILIGSSHDLQVGQAMFAIGNPFGLDHTLTTGVVSALNRSIRDKDGSIIRGLIQTDAAINPGNSGGPLLDSAGRLVGVNTAIYSPSGANTGIGFAVPVDEVNRVVPQLIAHGKYQRPSMGIGIDDRISALITRQLATQGVLILTVEENSAAAKAGLRGTSRLQDSEIIVGDIIQRIGKHEVHDTESLLNALEQFRIGDKVEVSFVRNNKVMKTEIVLE